MQLTAAHLRYLLAIYEVSRTHLDISSRSIAEKLGVTKPSVVRIMNLLMERGMIVKEHYGKIYMTDRGIFVAREVQAQLDRILQNFPPVKLELTDEEREALAIPPAERAPIRPIRPGREDALAAGSPRAAPAPPTASCYVQRRCARAAQAMMRRRRESWCRRRIGDMPATAIRQCPRLRSRGKERDARPQRALARRRRQRRRLRAPPSSPKAQGGVPIVLSIDLLANFARWGQRCRGPRKGPALFLFQSAR